MRSSFKRNLKDTKKSRALTHLDVLLLLPGLLLKQLSGRFLLQEG